MSGLLYKQNYKHIIAKLQTNSNRHGGKYATVYEMTALVTLLCENENIQNIKYKNKV